MSMRFAVGLPTALEQVVLVEEAPRSATQRLHLVRLQGAASVVVATFHVVITAIIQSIVAGPLTPSTSSTARFEVDSSYSHQTSWIDQHTHSYFP